MKRDELAKTYIGDKATSYDLKRTSSKKWRQEHAVIRRFLKSLPVGIRLLDVPIGTGRFIELYHELGVNASGVDVSNDMIAEATAKATKADVSMELRQGSIFSLNAKTGSFDCVLCIRLLNWLNLSDVEMALRELSRVTNKFIILGVRMNAENVSLMNRLITMSDRFKRSYLSKKRKNRRTTIHERTDIFSLLGKLGLITLQSDVVHVGMRGTHYELFLLKKHSN